MHNKNNVGLEKIIFENKPSTASPINATNLNLLQNNVDELCQTIQDDIAIDTETISTTIEELKESNIYSTEEKVIGKWIDGKPVYKKVIDSICGNLYTLLNELNIDFLIDIKGNAWSNYDQKMPINTPNPQPPDYVIGIYQTASTNEISVFYSTDFYSDTNKIICIVKYTKTTDEVVE